MADDDDDRGSAPDPWDEIVAEGLGDFGDETLRFEEPAGEMVKPVEPPPTGDEPDPDIAAAAADAVRGDVEEPSIEDWLSGDDGEVDAGAPVLSVFAPEDTAGGLSGIDIGTGTSGIAADGQPEAVQEDGGGDAFADVSTTGGASGDDWADIEPVTAPDAARGDAADVFTAAAAGAAAPAVIAETGPRARKPAASARGIGRVAGIVSGGLLAIPVTLAILLFGLGQDPFGVATVVPPFLLPAKFRPMKPQPAAVVVAAPAAPAPPEASSPPEEVPPEPALPEPAASEFAASESVQPVVAQPVAEEAPNVAAEPGPEASADMVAVGAAAPVEPQPAAEPEPDPMPPMPMPPMPEPPLPEPPMDAVAVTAPALDALVAEPPVIPPSAPAPPPLDTVALDEAVGEAAALGEALGVVADRGNRAYTLLRTRWYRALARVAEELVALEHAAAASGRPLDAPPENVVLLHGAIGGREALAAELASLGPDWLSYAKRGSDGVVLPVTFDSGRKVGPYWAARATFTDAAGQPQTVTLISRTEPAAVAGDRLVVTGVAIDGGVIWAADIRSAAAGGDAAPGS